MLTSNENQSSLSNSIKNHFLLTGISLFVVGIFFLLAFNWNEIHRYVKLGGLGFLYLASFFIWIQYRFNEKFSEAILILLFFLTGAGLLLFGSIYQTGADAYDLFFGWCLFTILLNFPSRTGVVIGLWISIAFLTIHLYVEQVYPGENAKIIYLLGGILFYGFIIIYEEFLAKLFPESSQNIFSPFLLLITLSFFFSASTDFFFDKDEGWDDGLVFIFKWIIPIVFLSLSYYLFRGKYFRLANVTVSLLYWLFFIMIRFINIASFENAAVFFIGFMIVILFTIFSIQHLLKLKKEFDDQRIASHES
ncbi:MAG: DUF2157 domain-containing protein [Leptospira sp.]|nr:DUF2157 domain-containing protein [Leptospira sp.]NCS95051.1 DUF2157 domain-containing protein [Leptospira sp.]